MFSWLFQRSPLAAVHSIWLTFHLLTTVIHSWGNEKLPLIYYVEFCFLGAAHVAYRHSKAVSQEAIGNTGAGPTGLELGHTGERSESFWRVDLCCLRCWESWYFLSYSRLLLLWWTPQGRELGEERLYLAHTSWITVQWGKPRQELKPGTNLEAGTYAKSMNNCCLVFCSVCREWDTKFTLKEKCYRWKRKGQGWVGLSEKLEWVGRHESVSIYGGHRMLKTWPPHLGTYLF